MDCAKCNTPLPEGKSKCSRCKHWNTGLVAVENLPSKWLSEVEDYEDERLKSGPWDKCFGGGIVPGSVTIISGAEGAGKSTMALQIAGEIAHYGEAVLFIATEEREQQVRNRAKRLDLPNQNRIRIIEAIEGEGLELDSVVEEFQPLLIVLDSLPGFFADIQPERALLLCKWFKKAGIATLITNHLNKDDEAGGYRSILYAVDVVMTFAEDTLLPGVRKLHCPTKNRHAATPSEVYFTMTERGLIWADIKR